MRLNIKGGLLLVLFFIMFSSVLAADIEFEINAISTDIFPNETAKFDIEIRNPSYYTHDYTLNVPEVLWIGYTDPLSDYIFSIPKKSFKTVHLYVKPKPTLGPGPYLVKGILKDTTMAKQFDLNLPIYLKDLSQAKQYYQPSIRIDFYADSVIDPRDKLNVSIAISNLNAKNIEGLSFDLKSNLIHTAKSVNISPNGEYKEDFSYKFDDYHPPMEDVIILTVNYFDKDNNKTYTWEETRPVRILSFVQFDKAKKVESGFLKEDVYITVVNNGNIQDSFEIKEPIGTFKSWFTAANTKPSILKTNEGKFYVWSLNLNATEEQVIFYSTDYKPLFYLIIIILLSIFLYYILRSPILVKKDVVKLAVEGGGISSIKIIILIKNRTNRIFENIRIIEKLPHIVNVNDEFEIGTVAPTKIARSNKKGSIAKWEISHLDPYEERIITYKLVSGLSILGGLSLPHTVIKFQDKKGRQLMIKSNRLNLEI